MGKGVPVTAPVGSEAVTFNSPGIVLSDDGLLAGGVTVGAGAEGVGVCSQVLLVVRQQPISQPRHVRVGVTVKSQHLGGSSLKMICVRSEIEAEGGDDSLLGGGFVEEVDDELVEFTNGVDGELVELVVFDEEEELLVWFVLEESEVELTVTLFPLVVPLIGPLLVPFVIPLLVPFVIPLLVPFVVPLLVPFVIPLLVPFVPLILELVFPFALPFVVLTLTLDDTFPLVLFVLLVAFPALLFPPLFPSVASLDGEPHPLMLFLVVGHGAHPGPTKQQFRMQAAH